MNDILKLIYFFILAFIIIYIFNDIYENNRKMKLLIKFVDGKNIYCENNIIINSNKNWYFNKDDKMFIKNDFYIDLNNNKCY